MLVILSPARKMSVPSKTKCEIREPYFQQSADELFEWMKRYEPHELESVLRCNPTLAWKAYEDYHSHNPALSGSPAILSYRGLVYHTLQAETFSPAALTFADNHLRLLSAMYGLLRPLDGIQHYRLELTSRVKPHGQSLYAYWGSRVCRELFRRRETVVNLASAEYAKLVTKWAQPDDDLIHCEFISVRRGKLKTITTEAKMARGAMAHYLVQNRMTSPVELTGFQYNGFEYNRSMSTPDRLVFLQS